MKIKSIYKGVSIHLTDGEAMRLSAAVGDYLHKVGRELDRRTDTVAFKIRDGVVSAIENRGLLKTTGKQLPRLCDECDAKL